MNKNICIQNDKEDAIKVGVTPIVYSGDYYGKGTMFFCDEFNEITIPSLVNNIESFRKSKSYDEIDLYFASNGGSLEQEVALVDYLNKVDDIKINIIVNGRVFSAGFFTVFSVNNPNINIHFTKYAEGLMHLPDMNIRLKGLYDTNKTSNINKDIFFINSTNKMIEAIANDFLKYLGLDDDTLDKIENGQDVYFDSEQLNTMYENLLKNRYYEDKRYIDDLNELLSEKESINIQMENIIDIVRDNDPEEANILEKKYLRNKRK